MYKYAVGKTVKEFKNFQDGVKFEMSNSGSSLLIFLNKPTEKEIEDIEKGSLQFKMFIKDKIIFILSMPLPIQIYNVFKSRWCGAHWQYHGIKVIPSITWSDERSYEFCFDGIEEGSTVAISTLGCKKSERLFMKGYNAMLKTIEPELIICYDMPFKEMEGNIKHIEYIYPGGGANYGG